jgi:carboxyl-terminal processing protease
MVAKRSVKMKFRFRKIIRSGYGASVAVFILILAAGWMNPLPADDKTYSSLKMFTDVLEELEH